MTPSAVTSRLARARDMLRGQLVRLGGAALASPDARATIEALLVQLCTDVPVPAAYTEGGDG